jgi:hypothetical protein
MTERTDMELRALEGRLSAIRMSDSERVAAISAMRSGVVIVQGLAWLGHKLTQVAEALFSKPRLAR